eukprot:4355794-Pyramimonas_sp.AAC.1
MLLSVSSERSREGKQFWRVLGVSWEPLGRTLLGASWGSLGHLVGLLGPLGRFSGPAGSLSEPMARNARSGPLSGHPFKVILRASRAVLEAS